MLFKKIKKESINNNSSERNYRKEFSENDMYYIDRNIRWQDTYYTIDKDENVLLQCRYKVNTTDDKGWFGLRDFHFYVIEKNGKKYCKFINLEKIEDNSIMGSGSDCYDFFKGHVAACNTFDIAIFLPKYRKRLIDNTEIIKFDKKFDELLESACNIDFEEAHLDLFECKFEYSSTNFDCYDFYNKHVFIADGFCLTKYEPYINILNYILSKSNYKYLNPSTIKVVESLDDAYKKMIEKKEEKDELDLMIE